MDFIIKIFRSHLSNLLFFSVLFSIVSIISESSLLSIVVGISLIAPLQISILSGEKIELSQLIDNVICRDSIYYTALYWATWVLPIIGGGLISLVIVVGSNFFTVAGMAVYAFSYAKMSPMLVRIATGHWGKKLLLGT